MAEDPERREQAERRQRVVRVPGSRRARLTPVDGSDPAPETPERRQSPASAPRGTKGPNDDRMLGDVPPHY
ncbi:hypothetical protein [Microbacterium hydrocarbonoxydans]|uniref:hypothetical protein n=1 Tax=Microbacterium hydrocarbonoxydans TaxID=273678 RepID=UPI00203F7CA6|nr:hypothetical protein [Microbacterium hydrocarbonoxydans]MCM3780102.1 hypothetical protein [Microbacterium hydrocarbonoxydans]